MELNQSIENPLGAGTQVGQGEAFVYTPNQNVFSSIQGALDKNLQLKQADLAKKEEAKKRQDAEMMKIMTDLQVDPKWDRSLGEMSEHIDKVGDLVYNWRASGKPIGVDFYTTLNREIAKQNSLKGMNEQTFNQYTKIKADLLANEKVDQADVELWEKGLDAQKTIEDRFNYINNTPKPGEYFDILKPFKDYFSEEEQQQRVTGTIESKQTEAEKAVWESRNPTERERMLRLAGKNLELKNPDGSLRPATETEYLDFVHKSMKPFYVKQVTPTPASTSTPKTPLFGEASTMFGTSGGYADSIGIANKKIQVKDNYGVAIEMIPSTIQYQGQPGESNEFGGMQIVGKKVGSTNTKTFTTKEEADAWASGEVAQGTIASDPSVDEKGVVTYRTLEDVAVPYDWNVPVMNQQYPGLNPFNQMNKKNPTPVEHYRRPLPGSDDPRNFQ
jgi:hypothetical protein